MITQEELKELLLYDDGKLISKIQRSKLTPGTIAGRKNQGDGYIYVRINYKTYAAHRLIWLYFNGVMPNGEIDHINHIRDDNRIENLRVVNRKENCKNYSMGTKNKSGFVGVSFHQRDKVYMSFITINRKSIYLGSFKKIEDAIESRRQANIKYGFHENHGAQKPI